jgi:hypothetical protein
MAAHNLDNPDNIDPMPPEQSFFDNTYYQILYVEPLSEKNEIITTNILTKTRGADPEKPQTKENHPESFNQFKLDEQTVKKLKDYPRQEEEPEDQLASYLPSPGVTFPKDFIDSLFKKNEQTELGNFYTPMRTLLHSRKLSQLIAKTWWSYLEAKKNDGFLWDKFTAGEWDIIDFDILDGLIARQIFLFGGGASPDYIDNEKVYLPLKPNEAPSEQARFMILPSSKCWQGISFSLLLAGQAYYKRGDKYHQICQPIFSTGEIVFKYSLEVDWNKFNGDIKEIIISHEKPWVAYHAVLPYPPIPFHADQENIEKWANAEDYGGNFPFYKKDNNGKYLIDVDYFRSPYPYIPLTCS